MSTHLFRSALAIVLGLLVAASASAQIRGIKPQSQSYTQPGIGEYEIARASGPGSFVSASVTALGVDAAQIVAYVAIDGHVVWSGTLSSLGAEFDQHVNDGIGMAYSPSLGGSARASFGLPRTITFQRDLRVYVRIEAGSPFRLYGQALLADPE